MSITERNIHDVVFNALAQAYLTLHVINLEKDTVLEFSSFNEIKKYTQMNICATEMMKTVMCSIVYPEFIDAVLEFTDLTTIAERLGELNTTSIEFKGKANGWVRGSFIVIDRKENGLAKNVIFATQLINEQKNREEYLLLNSVTDELTGFYNRRAYEDDLLAHNNTATEDNFVYISMDVNGLKIVNDTLGHSAGDELIIGAASCMKQCFGPYGRLYRIGGDEFAAMIFANEAQLEFIKKDFENVTSSWSGKLVDGVSVSCGYVSKSETDINSVTEISVIADKRMYAAKADYYKKNGIDRRGRKDAHVALCELYTKILKINISTDTYQIIDMDIEEQISSKGFTDRISTWLYEFGMSGQVHPDDLDNYLSNTNIEYMSEYFNGQKTSLSVFYRRKIGNVYKRVMMEIIPANDYSDDFQSLFLYVKKIDK